MSGENKKRKLVNSLQKVLDISELNENLIKNQKDMIDILKEEIKALLSDNDRLKTIINQKDDTIRKQKQEIWELEQDIWELEQEI